MPTNSNASAPEYWSGARILYYVIGFILSIIIVTNINESLHKKIVKKEYLTGRILKVVPNKLGSGCTISIDAGDPPTGRVSHEIILGDPKRIPRKGEQIQFTVITYKDGRMEIREAE